jgi:hypothetical protein
MTIKDVIAEIAKYNEATWLGDSKDIDNMLLRKGAKGSNLTIDVYAMGDTNAAAYLLFMIYRMADEKRGDLETLKELTKRFFGFQANRFVNYYHMKESHDLTKRLEEVVMQAASYEEFSSLIKAAQRFFGQLAYRIDLVIPWSELCKVHNDLMSNTP